MTSRARPTPAISRQERGEKESAAPCTIAQKLGAEEGDTPLEQQPAAMQDFDPTYVGLGSWLCKNGLVEA